MKKFLNKYIHSKRNLMQYFKCNDDYHINLFTDYKWRVLHDEGVSFLTYWKDGQTPTNAVVVKKDGMPLVFREDELTMVVAIDCIKIAFILKNSEEV